MKSLRGAKADQARQAKAAAANAHPRSTYKGQMRKAKKGTLNEGQIGEVTEVFKDEQDNILLFIPDIDSVFSIPLNETKEVTAQDDDLFRLNEIAVAKNAQKRKRPKLEQEQEQLRDIALELVEKQAAARAGKIG